MAKIEIELPDGSTKEYEKGVTVEEIAYSIGEGLGNDCRAGIVDGELVAKEHAITHDAELTIVTPQSDEYVDVMRHSLAHVLAQAVRRLYPDAKIGMGPWTENGFYYDFDDLDISEDDLERIQEEMQTIIEEGLAFERIEPDYDEARDMLAGEPYKLELLREFREEGKEISFYRQGDFLDLCKGPHVSSTDELGAFKLREIAGAYWKGDEDNTMLTRIYAAAFSSEDELEEFLEQRKEAEERDHRKIGKQMGIFHITGTTGPGLPLWGPAGAIIYRELQDYMHQLNRESGHQEVKTPHVYKTNLWKQSGHYDNYRDDMFLFDVEEEEYGLKPMNCPGHCMIYKQDVKSYRDLPVRYWEDGTVYRREQKGELSGLLRVWGFTQDDGHLFCRPDQVKDEARQLFEKAIEILEAFGMDYRVDLATRNPDKYIGSDDIWNRSEQMLEEVLDESDVDWDFDEGDAAFYGPKIDMKMIDALGREWDGPTIQLDFNMPEKLGLTYKGKDNDEHTPVMIHRALYGSYERFIAVLTEHFAGNFPLWLAPEQVRILPISDKHMDYAEELRDRLKEFRVEIEDRSWTVGKKIQAAHDDNVPYMIIVGDNEVDDGTIAVRDRQEREEKDVAPEAFIDHLRDEIDEKRIETDFIT